MKKKYVTVISYCLTLGLSVSTPQLIAETVQAQPAKQEMNILKRTLIKFSSLHDRYLEYKNDPHSTPEQLQEIERELDNLQTAVLATGGAIISAVALGAGAYGASFMLPYIKKHFEQKNQAQQKQQKQQKKQKAKKKKEREQQKLKLEQEKTEKEQAAITYQEEQAKKLIEALLADTHLKRSLELMKKIDGALTLYQEKRYKEAIIEANKALDLQRLEIKKHEREQAEKNDLQQKEQVPTRSAIENLTTQLENVKSKNQWISGHQDAISSAQTLLAEAKQLFQKSQYLEAIQKTNEGIAKIEALNGFKKNR